MHCTNMILNYPISSSLTTNLYPVIVLVANNKGESLFYKETLPVKVRDDLSFDECLIVETIFRRKHIFLNSKIS